MSDGYFRRKKGFTVVQNDIVRDRQVSMKAKGLYLVIQSYITMPDAVWHKEDFMNMVKEGKKAFESAWSELKEHGYLKVHMYSSGYTWKVEYDLLTTPEPGPHSFYYNIKGEMTSTNLDRKRKKEEQEEENAEAVVIDFSDSNTPETEEEKQSDQPFSIVNETCYSQKGGNTSENDIESTCYTQKGGNISDLDENTCYPHLGCNDGGSNGKEGNNYKYLSINTMNKDFIDNPSIYPSNTEESINPKNDDGWTDRKKDGSMPIILDPGEYISLEATEQVVDILEENDGIPLECIVLPLRMKQIIQVMAGWNHYFSKDESSETEQQLYQLVVKSLIEMTTERNIKNYGGSTVAYSHVIEQLNIIYRKVGRAEDCLYSFIPQVMERFTASMKLQKIKNPEHYLKSIIWNTFNIYLIDFDNYFRMTYQGFMD